jgi:cytochrome c2
MSSRWTSGWQDPHAAVPMSNMYFHVARAEQRRNVIAYLKASGN